MSVLACQLKLLHLKLPRLTRTNSSLSSFDNLLRSLNSKSSHAVLVDSSKKVVEEYNKDDTSKKATLISLASHCGVRSDALDNAIILYGKNKLMAHEVLAASRPIHYTLLRNIGNLPGGIKIVCDIREKLLNLTRNEKDKVVVSSLRRLEESSRELLTVWFCLSNLKLNRLTWESPGDIIHKIAQYEAVHPVRGLVDFQTRLGSHRRCFYFSHESLPREPLVMVHVALMSEIANSVQDIMKGAAGKGAEVDQNTAIYYSITSPQKGLAGIDLGNLLIKQVAAKIQKDCPNIINHSTLSPIPGFRSWFLRALHGHTEFDEVVDSKILAAFKGDSTNIHSWKQNLIEVLSKESLSVEEITPFKNILMNACARYLFNAKRNGLALNPVANFHLRNGAELYRLNWLGDTSGRGLANSYGIMVNYRYYLERVDNYSVNYVNSGEIKAHQQVKELL